VLSAVTIEAIEQGFNVIGFMDGFKWLVEGSTDHYVPLTIDAVKGINLGGGSICAHLAPIRPKKPRRWPTSSAFSIGST
jgi:6-phosphofructokinase